MLIEHPEVERRLRKEMLERVGSKRSPTSEDIRGMRYLKAFLNGKKRMARTDVASTDLLCRSITPLRYCVSEHQLQSPAILT